MSGIKLSLMLVFLLCQGCSLIRYNACGEGVPPEKADPDIKRMFEYCAPRTGDPLGDRSRLYYAVYTEGRDAEERARQNVAETIRRDITGKRVINIPLYDLELFKHYRYGDHFWGIYYIPRKEYNTLRRKYYKG